MASMTNKKDLSFKKEPKKISAHRLQVYSAGPSHDGAADYLSDVIRGHAKFYNTDL